MEGVQFLHIAEKSLFEWWTEFISTLLIQCFSASLLSHLNYLNCLIKGVCLSSKLFRMLINLWNLWCKFMSLRERLRVECHIKHCWTDHSKFYKRIWNLCHAGGYGGLQERFRAKFEKWSLASRPSIPLVMDMIKLYE